VGYEQYETKLCWVRVLLGQHVSGYAGWLGCGPQRRC
jgi:hypothetical protein